MSVASCAIIFSLFDSLFLFLWLLNLPVMVLISSYVSQLGFPGGSADKKNLHAMQENGLGRSPREGKGYPLQYSGLENSMDCIVHEVAKNQTRLSNIHFTS